MAKLDSEQIYFWGSIEADIETVKTTYRGTSFAILTFVEIDTDMVHVRAYYSYFGTKPSSTWCCLSLEKYVFSFPTLPKFSSLQAIGDLMTIIDFD